MKQHVAAGAFIAACFGSIAAGLWLAVAKDDAAWLLLCLPVIFFLS